MACTWFFPIFRFRPAVLRRCCMAAVRLRTPSGNLISSRLRCVRFGSAFFGCMVLSIWADMPLSAPFAFSKCNTAYSIFLLRFIRLTFRFVRVSLLFVFGNCRRSWQGVQRGATPRKFVRLGKSPNRLRYFPTRENIRICANIKPSYIAVPCVSSAIDDVSFLAVGKLQWTDGLKKG